MKNLTLSSFKRAFILVIIFFFEVVHGQDSNTLERIPNWKADSIKINNLISLSESRLIGEDSAKIYAGEALTISQKLNYKFGLMRSYCALISGAKNDLEVDSLMSLAVKISDESDPKYHSVIYLKVARRYLTLGDRYVKAFRYAQLYLADSLDSKSERQENTAHAWNIIGEVYRVSGNYEKARQAYVNAQKLSVKNGKIIFLSPAINIGTIQMRMGQLDSALDRYNEVEEYLLKMNEEKSNTINYIRYRKAQVYQLQNRFELAEEQATTGYNGYTKLDHNEGKILTLGTLSEIYFNEGLYQKAISYGSKAVELAMAIDYIINDVDHIAEIVSESYLQLNDLKNAYLYSGIQNKLRFKLYNPAIAAELINEQLKIENRNQELVRSLAKSSKEKDDAVISIQKTVITFSIGGAVLLSIASILLFLNAKTKHKLNLQLQSQKEEILTQSEELRATNEEMEATNTNLEQLVRNRTTTIENQNLKLREYAYFNAHRVRGPLARILGLIALIDYEFHDTALSPYNEMLKTASNELDREIKTINMVLESGI